MILDFITWRQRHRAVNAWDMTKYWTGYLYTAWRYRSAVRNIKATLSRLKTNHVLQNSDKEPHRWQWSTDARDRWEDYSTRLYCWWGSRTWRQQLSAKVLHMLVLIHVTTQHDWAPRTDTIAIVRKNWGRQKNHYQATFQLVLLVRWCLYTQLGIGCRHRVTSLMLDQRMPTINIHQYGSNTWDPSPSSNGTMEIKWTLSFWQKISQHLQDSLKMAHSKRTVRFNSRSKPQLIIDHYVAAGEFRPLLHNGGYANHRFTFQMRMFG